MSIAFSPSGGGHARPSRPYPYSCSKGVIMCNADDDLQAWLDAENERADAEQRERERLHKEALRSFNFEHAKFNFKRDLYAKAIGAGNA